MIDIKMLIKTHQANFTSQIISAPTAQISRVARLNSTLGYEIFVCVLSWFLIKLTE